MGRKLVDVVGRLSQRKRPYSVSLQRAVAWLAGADRQR